MPSSPHLSRPSQGRLIVLGGAVLLPSMAASASNVALPVLARTLSISFDDAQWTVSAYLAAITASIVLMGGAGDRFGRRWVLVAGCGMFAVGAVLCGLAPALEMLVTGRVFQGIGAAAMMALALSFVRDVVGAGRAGTAMGFLGTSSAVGTALGPMVGGMMISAFGWPSLFLLQAFPALALMVALRLCLPTGKVLRHVADATSGRSGSHPRLWGRLAASTLVAAILMSTLVVGPFYLSIGAGLTPVWVGAVMSIGPLVAAVAGFPAGRLVDRVGSSRTGLAGLAAVSAGTMILAVLPSGLGVIAYGGGLAVLTAGYALFQAANNTAVLFCADDRRLGMISGMLNLARNLGLLAGASILGAVFAAMAPDMARASPETVAEGVRRVFQIAFALAALAAFAVVAVVAVERWKRA